jgi:hypothetical protein
MNEKDSQTPDLFLSTIRSINSNTPREWKIEERTWHPKAVQEELYKFFTELMQEWDVAGQWGEIEKINIPKNMSRQASTYFGFMRFKNRSLHPIIANQLNGVYFNDGRLTVELNKYPPRDIHCNNYSQVMLKYSPQLKLRYSTQSTQKTQDTNCQDQNREANNDDSDNDFDILSIHETESKKTTVDTQDKETQVDLDTIKMKCLEEQVKKMTVKIEEQRMQLEDASKSKLQMNNTIKEQAKKIGDISAENDSHRKVLNKLKIELLSSD